jgi:hypothetical protein
MSCKHRALIIYTRAVKGTSSNLASSRVELKCASVEGHEGPHHDPSRGEDWEDRGDQLTHILREAEEEPEGG